MRLVEKPSAGIDVRLGDTSITSSAVTLLNGTSNSYEVSSAVTRTRAVPTTPSLCSSTTALPVASAVIVTARELG